MTEVTRRRIGTSMVWSGAGAALVKIGQLAVGVFAARVLAPHDFGVFAVAMVVYAIVINVSDLGVGSAVTRASGELDELAPTAVTMCLISAMALAGVMAASAGPLAMALGSPQSAPAIQVLALVALLAGPSAVPAALMTREFRQDLRFRADVVNFVAANVVMIPMALAGWGAMALAWSRVVGQFASVVVLLAFSPRRYAPGFNRRVAGELIRFGMPLVGANLTGFALGNADSVVLSRISGTVSLGTYTLANNVAAWPLGLMQPVLLNVGLPLVSQLRARRELLERFIRLSLALTTGSFFFASAVIAALAGPLVLTLYGDRWSAAIPVLSVLAVAGFLRCLLTPLFDVLVASRATSAVLVVNIAWSIALVPGLIGGVFLFGPVGAAWAQVCALMLVAVPITLVYLRRVTSLPLLPALRGTAFPLFTATLAALVAHGVAALLANPLLALAGGGTAALAVYLATSHRWISQQLRAAHALAGSIAGDGAFASAHPDTDLEETP